MDKVYVSLFTEMAHATEVNAERVLEYNKKIGDLKGYSAAKIMRDDFAALYDRFRSPDFDSTTLKKADYAKLLAAAVIVSQQIEQTIEAQKKALQDYKIDTIPKLDRIINCKNDEEAMKLANEIFQTKEEVNN